MKRVLSTTLLATTLLLAGCDQMLTSTSTATPQEVSQNGQADTPAGQPPAATARYVEFSPAVLDSTANTRRVLFFYANWCPTCRPVDADINARLSEIPADVTIIRVNYNDSDTDAAEEALAEQYGVTYQHTFVVLDGQGNELQKWNGGGLDEVLQNVQ